MATNPKLPPTEPLEEKPDESGKEFPWPLVIGIMLVVGFGLLAAYLFR